MKWTAHLSTTLLDFFCWKAAELFSRCFCAAKLLLSRCPRLHTLITTVNSHSQVHSRKFFCPLQPRLREFLGGALLIFNLSVWEWYTFFFARRIRGVHFAFFLNGRVSSGILPICDWQCAKWSCDYDACHPCETWLANFTASQGFIWTWLCCVSNSRWTVACLPHNSERYESWAKGPWEGFPLRST